jgi:hypothetical protein
MLPAVEPRPVEPMTLLAEAAALDEALEELLAARSEKRLVEPRVAPRLLAVELLAVPEVSEEEEVLVLVLVDTMAVVEADTADDAADVLEAFELEFRDETRFPPMLPRSPCKRGARSAANRSA